MLLRGCGHQGCIHGSSRSHSSIPAADPRKREAGTGASTADPTVSGEFRSWSCTQDRWELLPYGPPVTPCGTCPPPRCHPRVPRGSHSPARCPAGRGCPPSPSPGSAAGSVPAHPRSLRRQDGIRGQQAPPTPAPGTPGWNNTGMLQLSRDRAAQERPRPFPRHSRDSQGFPGSWEHTAPGASSGGGNGPGAAAPVPLQPELPSL